MFGRMAITLPKDLEKIIERKSKDLKVSRSEFVREALINFLGLKEDSEKKAIKKYGAIYEQLNEENTKISESMMQGAKTIIPDD